MVRPVSFAFRLAPAAAYGLSLLLVASCSEPTGGGDDPGPERPALSVDLFLAVHHEPGSDPRSAAYVDRYWPALTALVAAAEEHGHRLTLLMNPQWAAYIAADGGRLALVRGWEARGHELGLHAHGPSMNAWNGYTNQVAFRSDPGYLGTTADMMVVMSLVTADGRIRTAAVTDGDSDVDYPEGILYDVDGGAAGVGDLVSTPAPVTWGGRTMTAVRHARFGATPSPASVTLAEIGSAMERMEKGQVMGIVFHCFEFHDAPEVYRGLFAMLAGRGVTAKSVAGILSR